jgi:hypothetical protein
VVEVAPAALASTFLTSIVGVIVYAGSQSAGERVDRA